MYLTFTDLHLPVFGLCRLRGWIEKGAGRAGRLQPSIERKFFTFFLSCVKTVFEWHRPAPPSFSGFLHFLMTVDGSGDTQQTKGNLWKHNLGEYCSDFIPYTKVCLLVDLCSVPI